jgi:hypothetical protein
MGEEDLIKWLSENYFDLNSSTHIVTFNESKEVDKLRANITLADMLRGKSFNKRHDILFDLRAKVAKVRAVDHKERLLEKQKRKEAKEKRDAERSKEFKSKVKVGQIIKVAGTRDRTGIRLVMEIHDRTVFCRKLVPVYPRKDGYYTKDNYANHHEWKMVRKILVSAEDASKYIE